MLCVGLLAKGTVQCRAAALFGEAVEKTAWGAMQQVSIRYSQMSSSVPLSPGKKFFIFDLKSTVCSTCPKSERDGNTRQSLSTKISKIFQL